MKGQTENGIRCIKTARLALLVLVCLYFGNDADSFTRLIQEDSTSGALIEIGRRIFSDSTISKKGISCASCHQPQRNLMDGLRVSFDGLRAGRRNTPSLLTINAYHVFFWDGRATSLRAQVEGPVFSKAELDLDTGAVIQYMDTASVIRKSLSRTSDWNPGDRGQALDLFLTSLAVYVRSIGIKADSAVKRNRKVEEDTSYSSGRTIFYGKGGCSRCHAGTWYTDNEYHNTGVYPQPAIVASSRSRSGKVSRRLDHDYGRGDVVGGAQYLYAFRTPSLVLIAETAPYMHDGSLPSLRSVVDFYNRGGDALGQQKRSLSPSIQPLHLTELECMALSVFLTAL